MFGARARALLPLAPSFRVRSRPHRAAERPAAERSAAERPAASGQRPSGQRPAAKRPVADRPGAERPAANRRPCPPASSTCSPSCLQGCSTSARQEMLGDLSVSSSASSRCSCDVRLQRAAQVQRSSVLQHDPVLVGCCSTCLSSIDSQFARVVGVASAGFRRSRVRARERIRPPCELLSFSRDTAQRTRSGCCTGWLSPEDCQAGDLLWLRWDAAAFFVALPGNTSAAVMMRSSYRPSKNAGEFPAPLPSSAAPLYNDKPPKKKDEASYILHS